jgi:iron complex outermembrane receptor protein
MLSNCFQARALRAGLLLSVSVLSRPILADDAIDEVVVQSTTPSHDIARFDLPNDSAGITGAQADQTINMVDSEDALKYLPSLWLRKRNNGDTQAVMETRTWGVSSSARSLVYADDVLLTALIANDNSNGAPRWGMVAPEEIERIDMIYGPYAAEYPGNSMGGVVTIVTRQPDQLGAQVRQAESFQSFDLYKTHDTYRMDQTSASVGDRDGPFTWFVSGNHMHNDSQPLTFVTTGATINQGNFGSTYAATGAIAAQGKTSLNAYVAGALGMLDTDMNTLKVKLGLDLGSDWKASYLAGLWTNDSSTSPQTYLTSTAAATAGAATYAGLSGFTGGQYHIEETHLMQTVSLKSDSKGAWDAEATASLYQYLYDRQTAPSSTLVGTTGGPTLKTATAAQLIAFTPYGTRAQLDGTGWETFDAKAIWRPALQDISGGVHLDHYELHDPTYDVYDWQAGNGAAINANPLLARTSLGFGKAETAALWMQDAIRPLSGLTATLGGRVEWWRSFDGEVASLLNAQNGVSSLNATAATSLKDLKTPGASADGKFSPKASIAWQPLESWTLHTDYGIAYRFPTVFELYQNKVTGTAPFTIPNPNLQPERDQSEELALERQTEKDRIRLALFWENDFDYIASQTTQQTVNGVSGLYTTNQNVGEIRNRGVELSGSRDDVGIKGLTLSGSVTWLDARIIEDGLVNSTASLANGNMSRLVSVTGNTVPNVPKWRSTIEATYRPDEDWTFTGAVRYQGKMFSTLDNADSNYDVYQSFGSFLVADARVSYEFAKGFSGSFGVDNLNNAKYWEFHPFPQRTFFADVKASF